MFSSLLVYSENSSRSRQHLSWSSHQVVGVKGGQIPSDLTNLELPSKESAGEPVISEFILCTKACDMMSVADPVSAETSYPITNFQAPCLALEPSFGVDLSSGKAPFAYSSSPSPKSEGDSRANGVASLYEP